MGDVRPPGFPSSQSVTGGMGKISFCTLVAAFVKTESLPPKVSTHGHCKACNMPDSTCHEARAQCVSFFFLSSSSASPGYSHLLPFYCSKTLTICGCCLPWGQRLASSASVLRNLAYSRGRSVSLARIQYLMLPVSAGLPCRGEFSSCPLKLPVLEHLECCWDIPKLFPDCSHESIY